MKKLSNIQCICVNNKARMKVKLDFASWHGIYNSKTASLRMTESYNIFEIMHNRDLTYFAEKEPSLTELIKFICESKITHESKIFFLESISNDLSLVAEMLGYVRIEENKTATFSFSPEAPKELNKKGFEKLKYTNISDALMGVLTDTVEQQADIIAPLLVADVFENDSLLIYESDGDLVIDSVCCGNSANIITKDMVLFMAKKMGIVK